MTSKSSNSSAEDSQDRIEGGYVCLSKSLRPGHRRVWAILPHLKVKRPFVILRTRKDGTFTAVAAMHYNRFRTDFAPYSFKLLPQWIVDGYISERDKRDERMLMLKQLPLKLMKYLEANQHRCVTTEELIRVFNLRSWDFYKAKNSFGENIVFNKLTGWRYRMAFEIGLLLASIAAVESGNNDMAIGKAGEISRYQISPVVWEKHHKTFDPYRKGPSNLQVASQIAAAHVATIRSSIHPKIQQDEFDEIFWVAACWNSGIAGATKAKWNKARLPRHVQDYAERVLNIYQALQQERLRKQINQQNQNEPTATPAAKG